MRLLFLKTWRDIKVRKGQFIALIVLVALGITSYVSFVSGYEDIHTSAEESYRELKSEDFTTKVLGAPRVSWRRFADCRAWWRRRGNLPWILRSISVRAGR